VTKSPIMLIIGQAIAGMRTLGILNGASTMTAGCAPLAK
jgi:hypothetical protein